MAYRVYFLSFILIFIINNTFAQFSNQQNEKKVDGNLLQELKSLYQEAAQGSIINQGFVKKNKYNFVKVDNEGRLLLNMRFSSVSFSHQLEQMGCIIKTTGINEIYVWVPMDKLENVAELDWIDEISYIPLQTIRSVFSEGFAILKGDLAQATYNAKGQGIKVGVISNGINNWENTYNNGEITNLIDHIISSGDPDGNEGIPMLEIIHDFAPLAELYFAGIGPDDGPTDMANYINQLSDRGCKVLVDDIGWFGNYPYFQEGSISIAINNFTASPKNGCYVTAAGNDAEFMYTGINYSWVYNSTIEKYSLAWNNSNILNYIQLNDLSQFRIFLQWADDWNNPDPNLNQLTLAFADQSGNELFESVIENHPQRLLIIPTDYLTGNYNISINWEGSYSNQKPEVKVYFDYKLNQDNPNSSINFEYLSSNKHVFGHAIPENVISVAAIDSKSALLNVENFSSRGPGIQYIGDLIPTIETKQPKISATDHVSTFSWGVINLPTDYGFSGTSAAAPHIAGIAAQYFSKYPNDDYSKFLTNLRAGTKAFDGGNSINWSEKSGYGLANSDQTLEKRTYAQVKISQIALNGQTFGQGGYYTLANGWGYFNPDENIPVPHTGGVFLANQYFRQNSFEKYQFWSSNGNIISDVKNHIALELPFDQYTLKAYFSLLPQ